MPNLQRPLYQNRRQAGEVVAARLAEFANRDDVLVLGLPRGGVVVARAVADALRVPLDILVARKLGVPGMPEVALGAIVDGHMDATMDAVAWYLGLPDEVVRRIEAKERQELERRVARYRGQRPRADVRARTVLLVDDGLASGVTIRAAARAVKMGGAAQVVVVCPVGSVAGCTEVAQVADRVVVPATPEPLGMVSDWYEDFAPVSDDAVLHAIEPTRPADKIAPADPDASDEREVRIAAEPDGAATLTADLGVPDAWTERGARPRGLVIFAHGGGSSRQSYRNRVLAGWLRMMGWATLRLDLLLPDEQERDVTDGVHRFDIALIGRRLTSAVDWATRENAPGSSNIVLFGASTGAAAAVIAAAARPQAVAGVMSRGGRVDLAGDALSDVRAPVLMIVGGSDADTLRWNRSAIRRLRGDVTLRIVRRAGHTFEEPRAIGAVGAHAMTWLDRISPAPTPSASKIGRWQRVIAGRLSALSGIARISWRPRFRGRRAVTLAVTNGETYRTIWAAKTANCCGCPKRGCRPKPSSYSIHDVCNRRKGRRHHRREPWYLTQQESLRILMRPDLLRAST
ncbi:MAG: phosphoribosyltransferase family protein [Gemmatimonadaceae bacterium]